MASIEHIAIWARDLERMRLFYEKYFGAVAGEKYINSTTGFESYFLKFASNARLEIMKMPGIPESRNDPHLQFTGFIHISLSVGSKEEVDRLTSLLSSDGYRIVDGPRWTGDGYYECCILDPENNRIEITI
jgi:lactoylglutathione lyase